MIFYIQADGGSRGNPGPAGSGAVVWDEKKEVVGEVALFLGHTTNNVAEYTALIGAFELLQAELAGEMKLADIKVEMDSKLVIEQMKGVWKVKHPNMKPLHRRAGELASQFKTVHFAHIPREKNGYADRLANEAMDRGH